MALVRTCTAAIALLLASVNACSNHDHSSPSFQVGNDGPADPATLGYTLNHFALLTNNISAVKHFYGDILGMRTVFSYGAGTPYEILYMGYRYVSFLVYNDRCTHVLSHGGKNGTGYQTGDALFAEKTNIERLLEFLYVEDCKGADEFPPSTQRLSSFSHIGLAVPDIKATQARMEQYGVNIVKRTGEVITAAISDAAMPFGFSSDTPAAESALKGVQAIGFDSFLLVTDPDGNLLEIQPQNQ